MLQILSLSRVDTKDMICFSSGYIWSVDHENLEEENQIDQSSIYLSFS